jgi:hypothetical protein
VNEQPIIESKWCTSIHDTPLYKFIEALCDNNLFALVIAGAPQSYQLNDAWENILTEYSEAIGSTEHKLYLSLLKEITISQGTLFQIERVIELMYGFHTKQFAELLNKLLRVRFDFDPSKPKEYDALLSRCYNRSRSLVVDIKLKQIQLEVMEGKMMKDGVAPTRLYFDNSLITLSDYAGFHLTNQIMTSEFCTRLKRYAQYIENKNKK